MAWLLCWSLGGLVVMSFIPSKRVDRIFPIVPPLCLLLAASVARLSKLDGIGKRVTRWSGVALIFACVFTSIYSAQRVVSRYRSHDAALVDFGSAVRERAATNGWRYDLIGGREEGLLLYLRRTRFIKPAEAVERWNALALDALVAPAEDVPQLLQQLGGSRLDPLEATVEVNGKTRRYQLITRTRLSS
jgi:hypothetical protein